MAHDSKPKHPVDQQELKRSEDMWHGFIKLSKISIVIVLAILAFLALFFAT